MRELKTMSIIESIMILNPQNTFANSFKIGDSLILLDRFSDKHEGTITDITDRGFIYWKKKEEVK